MGATCGSLLCHPTLCSVPHIGRALPGAPLETSAQGTWEVLSWQQQQHSSRDPPSSRSMVMEHFVKCPELMSTQRAPATLTALPSTRPLLLLREFPFPCFFSTPLSQPGFSLQPSGAGEGSACTRVSRPVSPPDLLLLAGTSQRLCQRSKSQMHLGYCLQWKLCLCWGHRTRPAVSYRAFLLS